MSATTTTKTISSLAAIFAIEGFPKILVSDNGPQFTSEQFKNYCKMHGIQHMTTAPFHPASNGLAERFVQSFKTSVKKNIKEGMQLNTAVIKYLASYRFTPNAQGKTPAELIHGRQVRTVLSQIFEKSTNKENNQQNGKFKVNQQVYIRNFGRGEKWIEGKIERQVSKMLFLVCTTNGYCKRHANQMKNRTTNTTNEKNNNNNYEFEIFAELSDDEQQQSPTLQQNNEQQPSQLNIEQQQTPASVPNADATEGLTQQQQPPARTRKMRPGSSIPVRKSTIIRKPSKRFL